jgi:triacylglycerol esterase/lipase EstA (alpha/beta hydrolase family)
LPKLSRCAAVLTAAALSCSLAAEAAVAHEPPPPDNVAGKARSAKPAKAKVRKARAARADTRSRPILFVHGLDAFGDAGSDCAGTWNEMRDRLRAFGHTGELQTIKYYHQDTGCSLALDGFGSHATHFPRTDAHQNGSHDMDADIRHLGYHLAQLVWQRYTSKGITVDLVGHSMGGLIIRSMLNDTARRRVGFPSYLYVEDVTTLGTPHSGSGYASWCGWAFQCNQMSTGSSFLQTLASEAPNPQGQGGTDWTAMGSYDDGVVSETSATAMSAAHEVRYLGSMDVGHSDYQHRPSDVRDADVEYSDSGGPWYAWYDAPHAIRWSDFALTYGSW